MILKNFVENINELSITLNPCEVLLRLFKSLGGLNEEILYHFNSMLVAMPLLHTGSSGSFSYMYPDEHFQHGAVRA